MKPVVNVTVGGQNKPTNYTYKTVVLKSNLLFDAQVTEPKCIYVIKWDFDLNGKTVTIPENCVLEFDGGSLRNGSLLGEVSIINQPETLFEDVDCSELYISTMKHLSVGDVSELFDNYSNNAVIATYHRQDRRGSSHFYDIDGIDKIYTIITGSSKPNVMFLYYDSNFMYLERSSETWVREYVTDNIPENAKYLTFSINWPTSAIPNIDSLLGNVTFSFIDRPKIYISDEFRTTAENTLPSRRNIDLNVRTAVTINVNNGVYNMGREGIANTICIPYAAFKGYRYLVAKANPSQTCRLYFLKEEPNEFGEVVAFSDYYGGNPIYDPQDPDKYPKEMKARTIEISGSLRKESVIPSDCQYIIVTGKSWNGTQYIEQAPVVLYLCNSDYLYENGDYETSAERSNRDVNVLTQKFMHWNIGHFSNGGTHTNIDTQEEYDIRQPAYNNFFKNYVHDCHRLFNEYDDIFAVIDGRDIYTRNALDTKKAYVEFPKSHNYHQIACYFGSQLIDYSYSLFNSLKGFVSDTESGGSRLYLSHYGCGYSLSRYSIGNVILTVMHFHLPIGLGDIVVRDKLFTEIINISSQYGAVVLVGDFNVTRGALVHNDHVNFEDAGFTILNPLVGGEDIPTFPSNGTTLDWVLYKVPSGVTLSDFHVCTEATYTEDEQVHLLSDHWPISFSVNVGQSNIMDKNIGVQRYNSALRIPQWYDGEEWKDANRQAMPKILSVGDSILRGYRNGNKAFLPYLTTDYKQDAVSGAKFIQGGSIKDIPQQLIDESSYEPDIIVCGTGVNDWGYNAPLGTSPVSVVTDDTQASALDRTKVYDAVQYAFYLMIKKWPNAKRFFISNIKFNCDVDATLEGIYTEQNTQGYSYVDLLEGIKKICARYGVIYIDVLNYSFVNTEFSVYKAPTRYADVPEEERDEWNSTYYVDADGLHPTDRCYREVFTSIINTIIK